MLLLDAIAQIETGNTAVAGDHGQALSRLQIHREFWQDVHRRWPALDIGEKWEDIGAADPISLRRANNCGNGCLAMIEEYLIRHGCGCTAENIYACWNLGREGFRRRNFHLDECPANTIRNAMKVAILAETKTK